MSTSMSNRERLSIDVPVQLKSDLKIVALQQELSIKEYTEQALLEKLSRDPVYRKVQLHRYEDNERAIMLTERLVKRIKETESLPESYFRESALKEFREGIKDPLAYYERKAMLAQKLSILAFDKDDLEERSL